MTLQNLVQFLGSIITVWLVFAARDRLRMNRPAVRLALGGAGIILAAGVFVAVMRLLPNPREAGYSPLVDAAAFAGCALFAGLFVLSLGEIAGGTLQGFRRWRYYRRNAG